MPLVVVNGQGRGNRRVRSVLGLRVHVGCVRDKDRLRVCSRDNGTRRVAPRLGSTLRWMLLRMMLTSGELKSKAARQAGGLVVVAITDEDVYHRCCWFEGMIGQLE